MIIEIFVAVLATLAFAVLFHVPRQEYLYCAVNGGLGWTVYQRCLSHGMGVVAACLWAALVLTLVARVLSALRKMPSTVFLLAGIFTLVPGSGVYYTAYYLIMNDLSKSSAKGIETVKVAGAIVLGIVFGLSLPQSWFNRLGRATEKRKTDGEKENRHKK